MWVVHDSNEEYKTTKQFIELTNIVKETLDAILIERSKGNIDIKKKKITEQKLQYQFSENELLVRILNQQYCRTHEPNIYADQLKPLFVDMVLDTLYQHDEEFKRLTNEFVNNIHQIKKWNREIRTDILNTTYLDLEDHELLKDSLVSLVKNSENIHR